ncbi:DUF5825 family protein [Sphingomonas oryzagri]
MNVHGGLRSTAFASDGSGSPSFNMDGGRLVIDTSRDIPPTLGEIEDYCLHGLNTVVIGGGAIGPLSAPTLKAGLIPWLRALRDFTSCAVNVDWHADPGLLRMGPHLCHIVPPRPDGSGALSHWTEKHRFGLCYSRFGPGFIAITDRRGSGCEFILDTSDHIHVYRAAQAGLAEDSLTAPQLVVLRELEAEHLLYTHEGFSLALPYRMRHWPVPFTAI